MESQRGSRRWRDRQREGGRGRQTDSETAERSAGVGDDKRRETRE